jgi:uncharacterized membrane protein
LGVWPVCCAERLFKRRLIKNNFLAQFKEDIMSKTITAVFEARVQAENALRKLEQLGLTRDDVTLLVSEDARKRHFTIEKGSKAEEGAVAGASIGGLAGALFMAMTTTGAMAIPGLNIIASGALIGGLAGLGAGAATGGLVGTLVGLGVPEHEAKLYEDSINKGAILLAVEVRDDMRAKKVKEALKETRAQSITELAA